jgi:methionyl-tRNA synthetase
VWVDDYLEIFPPDPLRYYLAANAPETKDADFAWKDFQTRNNSELADVLGNLVNRTLSFIEKQFEGRVPPAGALSPVDNAILAETAAAADRIGKSLDDFQVRRAIGELMDLARAGNKYFNDAAPWSTAKTQPARCATTLNTALQLQAALALLMEPFLPFSAEKLRKMLNSPDHGCWDQVSGLRLADGQPLGPREILFQKIEDPVIDAQVAKLAVGSRQ